VSARPNVDTNPLAADRLRRESLIAAPALCRERVLQAVLDGAETRQDMARDFNISASSFTLRRILVELADEGLIVLIPDVPGYDDYRIDLPTAKPKTRRKAA
jgi:hypothetical protein